MTNDQGEIPPDQAPYQPRPGIVSAARKYWREHARREGAMSATGDLLQALWEFLRDSTPARLRRQYGDADYDWDYRVNTSSGALGWRDRLLGVFHSAYQPTEPALFHEMIDALARETKVGFAEFTFIDLGSGKGRTLLMASDYPFHRIVGVELLPSLNEIARQNLSRYQSETQKCFALETMCADAAAFNFPDEPLLVYLFNPFPEAGLRQVLANLESSVRRHPRPVYVLYHNPELAHVLEESSRFKKIGGTHQYSMFSY